MSGRREALLQMSLWDSEGQDMLSWQWVVMFTEHLLYATRCSNPLYTFTHFLFVTTL